MRRLLFHNFRLVFALDRWIRRRFTLAGRLLLGGLIAAGIFGVDTRQTLAYQLFSLILALLLIAFFSSAFSRLRLNARRELPRFVTVGETAHYRVYLYNDIKHPQVNLSLLEDVQLHPPSFTEFLQAKEPFVGKRNRFDNYVGYPRWVWLMSLSKGVDIVPKTLPLIPPHILSSGKSLNTESGLTVEMTLTPLRRGYVHFTGMTVARPDPFGLFNALHAIPVTDTLLILPKRYPVPKIQLAGTRQYQRGGINLAMSVGDTEEFTSLREYRPGDPVQHIHWKSFAKLGKPVIKEFQDEFFVRHALILDTFAPPGQLFEAAVSVAASFVTSPRSDEILLDLLFVGTQAYCFTGGRGLATTEHLLEVLACVRALPEQAFTQLYPLIQTHLASLSGAVCVLMQWDAPRQQLVRMLKNAGLAFLAIIVSRAELQLAAEFSDQVSVVHLDALAEGLANLNLTTK